MRVFFVIFLPFILWSCNLKKDQDLLSLKYRKDSIIIDYKQEKGYIKIPIKTENFLDSFPAYYFDTAQSSIIVYVPYYGVKQYNLTNKSLTYEKHLEYRYHKRNNSFKVLKVKDYFVLISNLQVVVFNKKLEIEANLRDTIESYTCSPLALHQFDTEILTDTILFKAMFVESDDFRKNKHYKRIYKDYEFVLSSNKIFCANCDKCEDEKYLTEKQTKELLKINPH